MANPIINNLGGKTTENYFSDERSKLQNKICTAMKFAVVMWNKVCGVMKFTVVAWKNRRKLSYTLIQCTFGLAK